MIEILILSSGGVRNRETEEKKPLFFIHYLSFEADNYIMFFGVLFKMPIMISMLIVGINSKEKKKRRRRWEALRSLEPLVLFIDQCYDLEQAVIPDFFAARNFSSLFIVSSQAETFVIIASGLLLCLS